MHNLESLLNSELDKNRDTYSKKSIERVSKLVKLVNERLERRLPYYILRDIEDYQLLYHMHTEWIGKSIEEMQHDLNGGRAFYGALNRRANKLAKGDQKYKKELIRTIFPQLRKDWKFYETYKDWKREYDKHIDWIGKEVTVLRKDNKELHAFYLEFRKWAAKKSNGDKMYQKRLIRRIFPQITEGYMGNTQLRRWKNNFDRHPEWYGMNSSQMMKNKELKGNTFCARFRDWTIKKANGDTELQQKLFESIFPRTYNKWKDYTTVEDWKKYYDSVSAWKGKGANYIRYDAKHYGNQFYTSLLRWSLREANGDNEVRLVILKGVLGQEYQLHTPRKFAA